MSKQEQGKHTPGPWKITGYAFVSDSRSPIRAIARTEPSGEDDPICWPEDGLERTANARLIAAAPEMFQALEELIAEHEYRDDPEHNTYREDTAGIMFARDAIKKATVG